MGFSFSQAPSGTNLPDIGANDFPSASKGKAPNTWNDDAGHKGAMPSNKMLANAHPHQSHSTGYNAEDGMAYDNHGFAAVHIVHGSRDKSGTDL